MKSQFYASWLKTVGSNFTPSSKARRKNNNNNNKNPSLKVVR
jgi:hypothetical protein